MLSTPLQPFAAMAHLQSMLQGQLGPQLVCSTSGRSVQGLLAETCKLRHQSAHSRRQQRHTLVYAEGSNGSNGHQGPPPAWPGRAVAPPEAEKRSGPKVDACMDVARHWKIGEHMEATDCVKLPLLRHRFRRSYLVVHLGRSASRCWAAPAALAHRRWISWRSIRTASRSWRLRLAQMSSCWRSRCASGVPCGIGL
jgi:hypothetical protein